MKPKASEVSVEQILLDIICGEDMDSTLQIQTDFETNEIIVADYEWRRSAQAPTLKEALIKFMQESPYKGDYEIDYD